MRLRGSLPRSLTAGRLRAVLELTQPKVNRLLKPLNARASETWVADGLDIDEFCETLIGFIGTADGLDHYQEAAKDVEAEIAKWRLSLDDCIFHDILQRFLGDPDFRAIFPEDDATQVQPGDIEGIREFLAGREHWSHLAEFAWATALGSGNTTFLGDCVSTYEKLKEELGDVIGAFEPSASEPAAQVAESETAEAQRGQLDEAEALLKSIRANARKFQVDTLDLDLLDAIDADVGALRDLAGDLKRQRLVNVLLNRFDEVATTSAETVARLDLGARMEKLRERLEGLSEGAGGAEDWLNELAQFLEAIPPLDREIQQLMKDIAAAASKNDLDAIQRHTGSAQEKKALHEEKVGGLHRHLGEVADKVLQAAPKGERRKSPRKDKREGDGR